MVGGRVLALERGQVADRLGRRQRPALQQQLPRRQRGCRSARESVSLSPSIASRPPRGPRYRSWCRSGSRPRRGLEPLPVLGALHARDDQPLHLGRTLEQLVDLGVPEELLQWAVAGLCDVGDDHPDGPGRPLRTDHDCPLEKFFRDAKIYQLFEGTAQVQRLVIARMQRSRVPAAAAGRRRAQRAERHPDRRRRPRGRRDAVDQLSESALPQAADRRAGGAAAAARARAARPGRGDPPA